MLKRMIAKLEDVEESLRSLYVAKDGAYVLDVEQEDGKLNEFRENNRKLFAQNEALQKQNMDLAEKFKIFEGIDPNEIKKDRETAARLKKKELIEAGEFEKLVEAQLAPLRETFGSEIKSLKDHNASLKAEKQRLMLNNRVGVTGPKFGVRAEAMDDVIRAAGEQFTITEDGDIVALSKEGTVIRDKEGTPLSLDNWLKDLPKAKPHYFLPSSGGGSQESGAPYRPGQVASGDQAAFLSNIDKIAKGEVQVSN